MYDEGGASVWSGPSLVQDLRIQDSTPDSPPVSRMEARTKPALLQGNQRYCNVQVSKTAPNSPLVILSATKDPQELSLRAGCASPPFFPGYIWGLRGFRPCSPRSQIPLHRCSSQTAPPAASLPPRSRPRSHFLSLRCPPPLLPLLPVASPEVHPSSLLTAVTLAAVLVATSVVPDCCPPTPALRRRGHTKEAPRDPSMAVRHHHRQHRRVLSLCLALAAHEARS